MRALAVVLLFVSSLLWADDHQHHHGAAHHHGTDSAEQVKPPRVILNKSPHIVWYQLDRLDNERLLLVERTTDDPKFAPVFQAILTRPGMPHQHRQQALRSLMELNQSDAVSELLTALDRLVANTRSRQRVGRQLAAMLLKQPQAELGKASAALTNATQSENALLRSTGYAALVVAGDIDGAQTLARKNRAATLDYLRSIALIPQPAVRASLRDFIVTSLSAMNPNNIRRAAISALAYVPVDSDENFRLIAPLVSDEKLMNEAVATLLRIPRQHRDRRSVGQLAECLVKFAEDTPADERTTDEFLQAMQLADQLISLVPVDAARAYRRRLREVTVRVVMIHTVEEEMRYDTEYFAVEAGRPVQVVFMNNDLMPHNLVISMPGTLRNVAEQGAAVGPRPPRRRKPYVPQTNEVLFATDMVQPGKRERLTFIAPQRPGEYPYVCTFPHHWMRMYGVMVVVEDLDSWLKNPKQPEDPVGNTREFVQSWTVEDFREELATGLQGRSPAIGKRIFTEATCVQCHKFHGNGGAVGPELTDVYKRWKHDAQGILREILDPAHKIDPKFAVHVIVTFEGKVISGIVVAEDDDSISILENPESQHPTVIRQDDIEDMVKSPTSMMPKALLDRFSKDEIFELLAFLKSGTATSMVVHE